MGTKKPKLVVKKSVKSSSSLEISERQEDISLLKKLSNSNIERIDLSVIPFESQSFTKTYYKAASLEKLISKKKLELSYEQEDNFDPENELFTKYIKRSQNTQAQYCFDILFVNKNDGKLFTVTNKPDLVLDFGVSKTIDLRPVKFSSTYTPVMSGDAEARSYTEHRFESNSLYLDDVLMLLNQSEGWIKDNAIKNKFKKESYDRFRKWVEYAGEPFKRIMNQTKLNPSILNSFLSRFVDKKFIFQLVAEMKKLAMDKEKKFELMSYGIKYQPNRADPLIFLFAAIYKQLARISSREDNLMDVDSVLKKRDSLRIYNHNRDLPIDFYRRSKSYLTYLKNFDATDAKKVGVPQAYINNLIKQREKEIEPFDSGITEHESSKSIIEILEENMNNRLNNIFSDNYWSESNRPRVFNERERIKNVRDEIKNVLINDDPKTVKRWKKILTEDVR